MNPSDITPLPDLRHGRGRAGPVRERRPVYTDLLPPCNAGCPAGENIQAWLSHAEAGRYEQAWRQLVTDNPLAAIHGRVCYHPCETACNRASLDSAVSIHAVERFLGDLAAERGWAFGRPAAGTGRRVLVIGSGPSGLSAAYHLARLGHEVEVRDSGERPGGMMRYGIPAYRLPRDVLDAELGKITGLGVRFSQGHRVSDLAAERAEGRFDAVFVAVGAHLSKRVDIPAGDAGWIVDAVSFLRGAAAGERPVIGRRVAVYGGGNTAMDAARVARRLGAEDALIVYRRTRAQMPAHEQEAADAEQEGIRIHWLRTITAFDGPELTVEAMELGPTGFPRPTGRFETLAADTVILALGQESDTAFLRQVPGVAFGRDGSVQMSAAMMTGCPGVFAGGDMVPAERTVTVGVGHGKKAARHIDAWLRGVTGPAPADKHPVAGFGLLNPWYFGDFAQRQQSQEPPEQRIASFGEVVGGLSEAEARYEAGRCLSCGNCFECDGCLGACPEDAVIKRRGGRAARGPPGRGTGHDVHRVAGPAADDPEHVQDRRGTDPGRDARRRPVAGRAGAVHLRRPLRCHGGAADGIRAAGVRLGAGGTRPGQGDREPLLCRRAWRGGRGDGRSGRPDRPPLSPGRVLRSSRGRPGHRGDGLGSGDRQADRGPPVRAGRAGRGGAGAAVPAVPAAGPARSAARQCPPDRGARPDQGTRVGRRAAVPGHLRGPGRGMRHRRAGGAAAGDWRLSLPYDPGLDLEPAGTFRAVFFGLGSDGTVGANKNTIKILGAEENLHAHAYFVYDSKKAGSQTVSHLRFGPLDARGLPGTLFTLQVYAEDCTGCALCVDACPVSAPGAGDRKAINLTQREPIVAAERRNVAFFETLPVADRSRVDFGTVRGTQFLQPLFEFPGACAGCGETPYVKLLSQLFGDRLVVANATGCSSIYGGNLPTTPWTAGPDGRGPAWSNSLFEDNAEFGLGLRLAADRHAALARRRLTELRERVGTGLAGEILGAPQLRESELAAQRGRVAELKRRIAGLDGPAAADLRSVADHLLRRSVWLVGGDGWAYDIGAGGLDHVLASGRNVNVLVLDTEVYSNTGGQTSKATPLGAVAKFAAAGKTVPKKDLALQAIAYGSVYVARVAMGADPQQTLKAFREAEAYDGPSLIIAYSHCIAHGIDMRDGLGQQHRAVASGYWPLIRYDPVVRADGGNPFLLDSPRPRIPLSDYTRRELRYRTLGNTDPAEAERLSALAQQAVDRQWDTYEEMATHGPARFPPDSRK